MNSRQITFEERYIISALRKQGLSQSKIARHVGKHRSSICREFRRNCYNDGDYRPGKAPPRTRNRRSRRNLQFTERDLDVRSLERWASSLSTRWPFALH